MFIICFYEDILMIFDSIILKLKGIMYLVYCTFYKNSFATFYYCSKLQTLCSGELGCVFPLKLLMLYYVKN